MATRTLVPNLLWMVRAPSTAAFVTPSGISRIWEDGTTRTQTDGTTTRITE